MAVRLQPRDRELLALIRRYRIVTPSLLSKSLFDNTDEKMKSTLKRLKGKAGLIGSEKLFGRGNDVYYFLTGAGAVSAGLSEKSGHEVTNPDDLARLLGQLLFCCSAEIERRKLLAEEFDAAFPGVKSEALSRRFPYDCLYIDVDAVGDRRLGRVIVDIGGSEVLFRAKKALADDVEVLSPFVAEGRYALALVVPTESKAKTVERQLAAAPLLDARGERVRVVVEAHEELGGLLLDGGGR